MVKNTGQVIEEMLSSYSGLVEVVEDPLQATVKVPSAQLVTVMQELKEKHDFKLLADLLAVDYPEEFQVIYHLMRLADCAELRVKVHLDKEAPRVPSLTGMWAAADCQERETFDLMGIVFEGHPNLKRILLSDDFEGHPLRKDYKVDSHREAR